MANKIGKKGNVKRLKEFYGILSKEAGDALEESIKENRKRHAKMREERHKRLFS